MKRVQISLMLVLVLVGGIAVVAVKWQGQNAAAEQPTQARDVTVEQVIDGKRFEVTYRRREYDIYGSPVRPGAEVSPETHEVDSFRPTD